MDHGIRPLQVAVVAPIMVRYDAISLAARDTVRALAADTRFEAQHFGCACDFPEVAHRPCGDVSHLLLDPVYQAADAAIFHFGIEHSLFTALLAGGPPVRIVRFHNVTPARFVDAGDVPVIERSLRQIEILRLADEIWADSPSNAQELLDRGFDPTRIRIIPLVVEDPAQAELAHKQVAPIQVLYIGRIAPSKGLHDLILAVAQTKLPQGAVRVTIAGNMAWCDPSYLGRLHDLIAQHDLTEVVHFAGTVDDAERERLLHAAHVIAIPSYHEGFCRPVAEGLRAGCVPLVYDAYNLPHIAAGLGRVVPTGDIAALAAAMENLVGTLPAALEHPAEPLLFLDRGPTSVAAFSDLAHRHTANFAFETVSAQMRNRLLRLGRHLVPSGGNHDAIQPGAPTSEVVQSAPKPHMADMLSDAFFLRPPEAKLEIPDVGQITISLHSTGDRWISDVIRRGEAFDAHILDVLRDLVVPGTVMVDVGANIGWFTVIGSRLVGESGHVFAVEPEPRNLRLLRRNAARNRCRNVTVLPCAAGTMGRARLFRSADNQGDHRLEVASDRSDSIEVAVRPLDILLASNTKRVGLVKMDTQGSESAVLRGMGGLLATQPHMRVVLEFWPYGLLRCGSSVAELADLLNERSSSLWLLMADGTAEETSAEGLCELAASRFAPETQAHADLVWLAKDDHQAIAAMQQRSVKRRSVDQRSQVIPQGVLPVVRDYVESGLMRDPAGLSVWDLGCGDGRFVAAFLEAGAGRVLASDLHIPWTGVSEALRDDPRVTWLVGDCGAACRAWGQPVPADLVFMSLMTEHIAEPRAFLHAFAAALRPDTEVLVHHDNFFQPVGHHDHGLLFLNDRTWSIDPQGIACWCKPERCAASAEHRETLLARFPQLWSQASEATRDPASCATCNYFQRSRPWAHLLPDDDFFRTFPEEFFRNGLNRITPDQLKWFVQEAGFLILKERRTWVTNEVPPDLAYRYGRENLSTFTVTLRLRLK